ncbi:hypothetical protein ACF06W_23890 [Streptomyces albus]|uniref:hypothetical protein n=1 Tax=Streptomyces albus TaxID=1888 RepID=UPI0036FF37C0
MRIRTAVAAGALGAMALFAGTAGTATATERGGDPHPQHIHNDPDVVDATLCGNQIIAVLTNATGVCKNNN